MQNPFKRKSTKKEQKEPDADKQVEKTALDKAQLAMEHILKESTEAKELSMKIDEAASPFAKLVVQSLKSFHEKQDDLYLMFKRLVVKKANAETDYARLHEAKEKRSTWYNEKVNDVATSLGGKTKRRVMGKSK